MACLNTDILSRLPLFLPTLPEQFRIAAVLDTVDEAIAKTEAVIAKLKQVRAGLLHDLLTRGLDEHGQLRDPIAHPEQFQDSPLGRIPREWTVGFLDGTISQPSDLTIGPFGSNLLASDYRSEGAPVMFVRDIRENSFVWNSNIYVSQDKADELRAHCVFAGDVLITKMGLPPCIAAVYPSTMPSGIVTADVIRLRPRVDVATSFWLVAYINSPRFAACVRQITGGVTRPKVTLADFRKQPVLLPSVEEQERIKNIVMAMVHGIDEVEAESQKLLMLKSGLMTDLLTGRVRVPEGTAVAS
jgi:type I restriction enzyme S subunit